MMHIHELRLAARDLAALHAFYGTTLGVPVVSAATDALRFRVGGTDLIFTPAPHGTAPRYHFAFNVPPQHFAAARAWLAARTPLLADSVGTDTFVAEGWNAHMVYFRDPAGNIGELIAREEVSADADQPFDASGLLCVSEVGLATDDVPATVAMLGETLGVAVYRASFSDTFAAVGDAHGLCIVVRCGREWYPDTGTPAEHVPVSMLVALANDSRRVVVGPPYRVE